MMRAAWTSMVCAAVMIGAPAMHGENCAAKPGDDAAIVQTIRTMFAAAANDNIAKFDSVVAPGFYMYDNGRRYDGDAMMKLIIDLHAKGAKFVWSITNPDIHVNCDDAWIAYVNDGSVQMKPDAPATPMKWLESAVLRREDGQWKVAFFHSTRQAVTTQ